MPIYIKNYKDYNFIYTSKECVDYGCKRKDKAIDGITGIDDL